MSKVRFKVESAALLEAPVFCSHRRGKNWCAVIAKEPNAPGGLKRVFLPRAKGQYYYIVASLKVGDPVEFGADYYTASGKRSPERWYGVVLSITDSEIMLEHTDTANQAIDLGQQIISDVNPLIAAKQQLLKRLSELERQIAAIESVEELQGVLSNLRKIEL